MSAARETKRNVQKKVRRKEDRKEETEEEMCFCVGFGLCGADSVPRAGPPIAARRKKSERTKRETNAQYERDKRKEEKERKIELDLFLVSPLPQPRRVLKLYRRRRLFWFFVFKCDADRWAREESTTLWGANPSADFCPWAVIVGSPPLVKKKKGRSGPFEHRYPQLRVR